MSQGKILNVVIEKNGDFLSASAGIGATVLSLYDLADFAVEGGTLSVNGVQYTYTFQTPLDEDNLNLVVSPALTAAVNADDEVLVIPLGEEKWASVQLEYEADSVRALVPHTLHEKIPDGVRDEYTEQETVTVDMVKGVLTIVNLEGVTPSISGAYFDPVTVPVSPEVDLLLDELTTQVLDNTTNINNNATDLDNLAVTAQDAYNLADTADGRISISDYEPGPDDVSGRTEGSIWFTRTRARVNYCTNPSFETNTNDWTAIQGTTIREAATPAIDGAYIFKMTNSGTAANHIITWDPAGVRQPCEPGQTWTVSTYADLISGAGTGCYIQILWYDAAAVALPASNGAPQTLLVGEWLRLSATAVAPATAASFTVRVVSPTGNESAVWRTDGVLVEQSATLGRYFDGDSYDCSWLGTALLSSSSMIGGKIIKIFELDDGSWIQKFFMGDNFVDINASTITSGYMDGERIQDGSIPIDKMSASPCQATEDLAAGDFVNVYNLDGTFRCQKAVATADKECHGFVLASVSNGAIALVFSSGYNPFVTGLVPGTQFLSTTAGKASSSPPQDIGQIVQRIGVAIGPTVMNYMQNQPIYIV